MENKKQPAKRKAAVTVVIIVTALVLVAGGVLITAYRLKDKNAPKPGDPVLVVSESSYLQYEIRNDEILLSYRITLKNPSDKEFGDFRIGGVFDDDYESGIILDKNADARETMTGRKSFSLEAGEKQSYDLVFSAQYFRNQNKPSQTLPSVIITTSDGREIKVSKAD